MSPTSEDYPGQTEKFLPDPTKSMFDQEPELWDPGLTPYIVGLLQGHVSREDFSLKVKRTETIWDVGSNIVGFLIITESGLAYTVNVEFNPQASEK